MDAATARRYAVFLVLGVVLGLAAGVVLVSRGPSATPAAGIGSGVTPDPVIGAFWTDVPRPTGAEPAGCSPTDATSLAGQSLIERAKALRSIGLFADLAGADDAELRAELDRRLAANLGGAAFDPGDVLADVVVASLDEQRVWWRDLEADVVESNQVYVQTLGEWAEVSVGTFQPADIAERWDGESGPVRVTFTLDGRPVELRPEYLYDWIDPRIIVPINDRIDGSGRQFETLAPLDQTAVVLALTPDEKRDLVTQRGWCFAWP